MNKNQKNELQKTFRLKMLQFLVIGIFNLSGIQEGDNS